jgi:hypothetical protein
MPLIKIPKSRDAERTPPVRPVAQSLEKTILANLAMHRERHEQLVKDRREKLESLGVRTFAPVKRPCPQKQN